MWTRVLRMIDGLSHVSILNHEQITMAHSVYNTGLLQESQLQDEIEHFAAKMYSGLLLFSTMEFHLNPGSFVM